MSETNPRQNKLLAVYVRLDEDLANSVERMTRRLGISNADVARIALVEKFEREAERPIAS
jgi:hypothetical protein